MKKFLLKIIYKVLASYGRKVIARNNPYVIAITGSVGKTSAKEAVYKVLSDHFGKEEVRKNFGNLNAEIGVPLTILGYRSLPLKWFWPFFLVGAYFKTFEKRYPKYLVLEFGVEHRGDIQYLTGIARPNMAIITSVAPVHLANFKDASELAREKISLAKFVENDGKVFVNADEVSLKEIDFPNVMTVGLRQGADFQGINSMFSFEGTEYHIVSTGQKISIKSKVLGNQSIYSQLFAFAVGRTLGIQSLEIKKSLEKINPINGRMHLLAGKNGTMIIDDSYNASPASVKAALEVLSSFKNRRKVAILGNMNELGKMEGEAHLEVGKFARNKCDFAVFVGPNASTMARGFESKDGVRTFCDRKELLKNLDSLIEANDLILIKASQNGNFFEEVTKALLKDPSKSSELLVRQSGFWMRKKKV